MRKSYPLTSVGNAANLLNGYGPPSELPSLPAGCVGPVPVCPPTPPPAPQLCLLLICLVSNAAGLFGQRPFAGLPADHGKHHAPGCTLENAVGTELSCLHSLLEASPPATASWVAQDPQRLLGCPVVVTYTSARSV